MIFSFLLFYGVVEIENEQFKIVSETARLFIKSLSEFMRNGKPLIPVWDDRSRSSSTITKSNVFLSANFLSLIEDARKKVSDNFKPIFTGDIVRAAIVRRVWGQNRYLMQYSEQVGKYQLIGGMFSKRDKSHAEAMKRKLIEEVPELADAGNELKVEEIFRSQRDDEEILFSQRRSVYARYKTYIYSLRFKEKITKVALNNVSKNKINRWVTMKEIEREKAKDGKAIFRLEPNAIVELKKLEPNTYLKKFEISALLEETWVKVVLAIATISGVTIAGLVTSGFNLLLSWIQTFLSQG